MEKADKLKFSSLEIQEQGGLEVALTLDAEALASLGAQAPFAGPVALKAEFSVGGKDLLLLGTATGRFSGDCARCLEPVTEAFQSALERTYELAQQEIDISEEVRESVLLALPERMLCRPDCKGLCPQCGKNLNEGRCACTPEVPTAFSKLKDLKRKKGT